jgi:hypothetical protein|tara:strand:+ start:5472 stop:5648 length:177 start_codon:yes stop_codon:yes gene_type:complete
MLRERQRERNIYKVCFLGLDMEINFTKYDEEYMIKCDLEAVELGILKQMKGGNQDERK